MAGTLPLALHQSPIQIMQALTIFYQCSRLQASQRVIDYLLGKNSRQNHCQSSFDTLVSSVSDDTLLKREREKKRRKYVLVQEAADSDRETSLKTKLAGKIEEVPSNGEARRRNQTK